MKQIFGLFAILLILIIGTIISQNYLQNRDSNNSINSRSKTPTATINNHTFKLEVAKTQKEKGVGLSTKSTLEQNVGMLFPFDKPGYYPFWMKNMKFPIDIIFIRNGRIVTIHKNIKPPRNPNENPPIYNSKEPADIVLEINAGLSEKYKFKRGDIVKLENV